MQHEEFNAVLEHMIANVYATLGSKGDEYSTEDRLHNFKQSASMAQCTQMQALGGMMVKHTTSIYDMIRDSAAGKKFSTEKWDEKITDHLNYLILLKAITVEEENEEIDEQPALFGDHESTEQCGTHHGNGPLSDTQQRILDEIKRVYPEAHVVTINQFIQEGVSND